VWAVTYVESHPDKDMTFLGVFSSEEKAEEAMCKHMAQEKVRLPRAYISESNYHFHECILNTSY